MCSEDMLHRFVDGSAHPEGDPVRINSITLLRQVLLISQAIRCSPSIARAQTM
jgi:hypothetical protein